LTVSYYDDWVDPNANFTGGRRLSSRPRTSPQKPKQTCPHCGVKKVGLADHIRDKHGTPANPLLPKLPPPNPRQRPVRSPPPGWVQLDCPECGAPMRLKESHYGLFYGCTEWGKTGCKGSHGAHPDGRPLGIPADDRTKKMRMAAHNAFDPLWNGPAAVFDSREAAYAWMQQALGKSVEDAHIGRFNRDDCKALVEAIWAAFGD